MNTYIKVGISFVAGLAIGAFAAKKYIESKYEFVEVDEKEDVVETTNIDENTEKKEEVVEEEFYTTVNDERINYSSIKSVNDDNYVQILNDLKYKAEVEAEETKEILGNFHEEPSEPVDTSKPYNISQDEFEDVDAYESDEYTYFADGYVTDSYGMPLSDEDIENSIGLGFADYFGTYDDNQIWIRNERLQMDFSVIKDLDNFADVCPPRIRRMAGL